MNLKSCFMFARLDWKQQSGVSGLGRTVERFLQTRMFIPVRVDDGCSLPVGSCLSERQNIP